MCIVTREVRDEQELIRFVRGPDGEVVPDLERKLPGRGVWVGLNRARVEEAVKRRAFNRGLGESRADPYLPDRVGIFSVRRRLRMCRLPRRPAFW